MAVLYSNNLEAETLSANPSGWVTGVGGTFFVTTIDAVGGSKALGRSDDAYATLYTGIAARADMGMRSDHKARFDGTSYAHVGHILRSNATYSSGAYLCLLKSSDGANLFIEFFQFVGFHVSLGASSNVISVTAGDTVHFYTDVIGSTLRAYVWKNAQTKPASPSFTITDTSVTAAGYAGLRCATGSFTTRSADNIVITDGAGGDDFFDASGPTTATLTGPTSGTTGAASSNFTVTLNTAATSTVTITPAGTVGTVTFSPSSPTITAGNTSATFTATPASDGAHSISITTSPTLTYSGSPITYTTTSGGGGGTRTVTLSLTTDGTNPAANLTGLKWAFFDQTNPGSFVAPTAKGTTGSTNSSGVFTATITGTALTAGQTGWLLISDSDGTVSQSPPGKAFSAPVTVS